MPKFIAAPSRRVKGIGILASLFIVLSAAGFSLSNTARAADAATPTTTALPAPRETPAPAVPENALLSEKGAAAYHLLCLPCHGDQGQGLTADWRARFGPDQTCADCHASENIPARYAFPKAMPPLVGQNTLQRFVTARDLKEYIQQNMPWWDPGFMAESQAWELTAFLLRENGRLAPNAEFDTQTASLTPIHLERRSENGQTGGWGLLGLLGLGAFTLALFWRRNPAAPPAPGKRPNFFYHLHPPTIPAAQSRFRYTLGMGGISVFLMLVLGLTGLLEMFFYIPTPQQAGTSVQVITFQAPFGALIRNLHFWSAQFLVVTAGLHLLRVVFTGAYSDRRRFNFLLGMLLFMLVFFLDFTGYILRWDEGIRWALLVGTNLLQTIPVVGSGLYRFIVGGETPGAATLIRFYAWHIFGLTLAAVILLGWHLFRVRRDGGIAAPKGAHGVAVDCRGGRGHGAYQA